MSHVRYNVTHAVSNQTPPPTPLVFDKLLCKIQVSSAPELMLWLNMSRDIIFY